MDSVRDTGCSQPVGSPIRKSPDHGLLASPRSVSPLAASFIACLRLGILTYTLSSLTIKLTPYTEVEPALLPAPRSAVSIPPGDTAAGYRIQRRRADYPSIFSFQGSSLNPIRRRRSRKKTASSGCFWGWWAWVESNYRPHPYQGCALAT